MKKTAILLAFVSFLFVSQANAQFDLGMLDNAMSLVKNGDQTKAASVLQQAIPGMEAEAKSASGSFGPKILSQVGNLGAILPVLTQGKGNLGAISKIINTVKMLFAAQRLSGLMNGKKFTGNSAQLLSNVGVLKGGLGTLTSNPAVSLLAKNLDKVSGKSAKLDKSGLFAGFAKKAISKKVGSSLGLLNGLL